MKELRIDNKSLLVDESIYSTANGYIGIRGNFEEGYKSDYETIRGNYLNGYFDTHKIKYSESAYGFPEIGETMVNVFDGQTILFKLNGEVFSIASGKILDISRDLNVYKGYSTRKVKWESSNKEVLLFEFKRLTSFITQELFLIDIKITSISFDGEIEIISTIAMPKEITSGGDDPRVMIDHILPLNLIEKEVDNNIIALTAQTGRSNKGVKLVSTHSEVLEYEVLDNEIKGICIKNIKVNESISFTKYCVYTDEHKHKDYLEKGYAILCKELSKSLEKIYSEQEEYLRQFWRYSKITIKGDEEVEKAILYSMYQLLSSAGRDGISQVSAKGLSGSGYEGHYFWDTEIYLLPFFTLTQPKIAKELLRYRYLTLSKAKERARNLGHNKGAKIPWRTISGNECSSYFPAGTAQYHINADVAYSYIQYFLFTDDLDMIKEFGFEVILETARIWLEVGHFKDKEFRIDAVTGPDEYTAIVNNNFYTNVMALAHLRSVVWLYRILKKESPELLKKLKVEQAEMDLMELASKQMYLPFDDKLNIYLQDDNFLNRKVWDFENTPENKYPLLLNYHPLTIYRHQVLKQADTILAHFLLDNVSDDRILDSFNYYEKITTHDSSLSPCVYGMMASRINDPQKAYNYLMKTIFLDLENLHGNTKDGLHIANAGGAYMAIVYGFAGLRIKEDKIHFRPTKPEKWSEYSFRFNYQGDKVKVVIGDTIKIYSNKVIYITIDNHEHKVNQVLEVKYHGKH